MEAQRSKPNAVSTGNAIYYHYHHSHNKAIAKEIPECNGIWEEEMTVTILHVCDSRGHWSVVGVFANQVKAEIEANSRGYANWNTSE